MNVQHSSMNLMENCFILTLCCYCYEVMPPPPHITGIMPEGNLRRIAELLQRLPASILYYIAFYQPRYIY
jgi:hypothetical protein